MFYNSQMPLWISDYTILKDTYSHYFQFLASQDAIEVMFVTEWVSEWLIVRTDLTDVTLRGERIILFSNSIRIVKND